MAMNKLMKIARLECKNAIVNIKELLEGREKVKLL
jgi:hypothetical protein